MGATTTKEQALRAAFVGRVAKATDGRGLSGKTRLLIIAHAALESGWGSAVAAQRANNLFNITTGANWKGEFILGPDLEYPGDGGNPVKIEQKWRKYKDDAAAIADYLDVVLQYRRYLPARAALLDGDPESFVRLLGPDRAAEKPPVGGYYTLPTTKYLRVYNATLAEVMDYADEGLYAPPASNPPPICKG